MKRGPIRENRLGGVLAVFMGAAVCGGGVRL